VASIKTEKSMDEVEMFYLRTDSERIEKRRDFVAIEEPFHILINKFHYATILCTPTNVRELVIGNIISEGFANSFGEIEDVKTSKRREINVQLIKGIDVKKRLSTSNSFKRLILSACGPYDAWSFTKLIDRINIPRIEVNSKIDAKQIVNAARQLSILATNYRKTGGLHSASLYHQNGELITFSEDVGRHNAIDKVIGIALLKNYNIEKSFLMSSGRLSGDIVLKAARLRIPIVASLSSALKSGIEVAKKTGITLIGFVRGKRLNIYSYPERITINIGV
jgi:FdhD protein